MDEQLKLSDFDILGIISLKDVEGIEKYVTQIGSEEPIKGVTEYYSRSKEYYNVKTLTELSEEREELKRLLYRCCNKRNFVILENMLNCSGKVYFKKFEEFIYTPDNEIVKKELATAKKCLQEDVKNIVTLLDGRSLFTLNSDLKLPVGRENSEKRAIEMDNKGMLYLFTKSLQINEIPENIEVLTPGYGSIYIGPFLKEIHGYDFTNLLKSKYVQETTNIDEYKSMHELVSSDRIFDSRKTVLLIDDNIGTGNTMLEIKKQLQRQNVHKCISGAVQYNWRNYYKISVGKKIGIDRFDVNDFEILTPLNYAGHKLYKHAIDILHSSAEEYKNYLNSKSYRLSECSDIMGALLRGIVCSKRTGLRLNDFTVEDSEFSIAELEDAIKYNNEKERTLKPEAIELIQKIIDNVKGIEQVEQLQFKNQKRTLISIFKYKN